MTKVKWNESKAGIQSSDRINRAVFGIVACIIMLGFAYAGIDRYIVSGGLSPSLSELASSLLKVTAGFGAIIAGWKGLSNFTDKFNPKANETTKE